MPRSLPALVASLIESSITIWFSLLYICFSTGLYWEPAMFWYAFRIWDTLVKNANIPFFSSETRTFYYAALASLVLTTWTVLASTLQQPCCFWLCSSEHAYHAQPRSYTCGRDGDLGSTRQEGIETFDFQNEQFRTAPRKRWATNTEIKRALRKSRKTTVQTQRVTMEKAPRHSSSDMLDEW